MIREAIEDDAYKIALIYNHYILNSTITFDEKVIDSNMIKERLTSNKKLKWWVYDKEGKILGYAYPSLWKRRSAYRYTVETSIYIAPGFQRKGIGILLYNHLLKALKVGGFHIALAGISLPNDASIAFHEKIGFKKVGQLERVGFKFNKWIDI